MNHPRAIVIGAGFGGLGSAIRLQARGWKVTLLEMRDQPGGRAYVYRDRGFTYDAGPTVITVPFVLGELFTTAGKNFYEYVNLVLCNPYYRLIFPDGKIFNYTGNQTEIETEITKFNPSDVEGYRRFMQKASRIFDKAFTELADYPFTHLWDMIKVSPHLVRLRADQSVFKMVSTYIQDPYLRQVFSFEPLLIGGNPMRASSVYSMIHHLEKTWGIHYAMGGTGALVQGLTRLFQDIGGILHLNTRVTEIECGSLSPRKSKERFQRIGSIPPEHNPSLPSVIAVKTADGRRLETDVVVSNGDLANTYKKMIRPEFRKKWTNHKLERMRYAPSLFIVYFGTNRAYPNLTHHTIVLGPRYQDLLRDIFDRKIVAKDFSLYLHAPSRTDPSVAPPNHECFYALSPVPHLGGGQDWDTIKEEYANAILASLEKEHLLPNLRKHIVSKLIFTPKDFETHLDAFLGSAFQFEPTLTQSAWFRPHNVSEDIDGLYFVGAGTHPGAGLPGVLSSAKLLDRVIPKVSR